MKKDLNELNIIEAITGLKAREFTSQDLVEACLSQIHNHDDEIKSFITLVDAAMLLNQARNCDALINSEGSKVFETQPLLGIPYACKDNFNTLGIKTTASSNVLKDYVSPYESTVTQRLKNAGAILLGKTNLDAFAHGSSTETSDFFTTKNPWDTNRLPGGSSGGSAAAVAAHMCIFAIGSETAGSIRGPASWCGVTGLKPTYGRVSRYGVIAMASSFDCPGPIAKNVDDCAYVLEIIAGNDLLDATSSSLVVNNYYSDAEKPSLKGKRVGVPASYFEIEFEAGVKEKVKEGIEIFKELGAELVEIELLDPQYSIAVYTILQRSEVSSNLARLDGIRYGNDRTHFGEEARKRMMLGAYALSAGYYDAYYAKAQRVRTLIVEDFAKAFKEVDLILGPTLPSVAPKLGASKESAFYGELVDLLQEPSAIAGLSAISLPCGFVNDMPVGIQIIGPQFEESKILGAAKEFQGITDFHLQFPKLG